MKTPKISIVMPSLNVREYIEVCLESVVNQTFKDIEIFCVDAGSTDGTLEVLEAYAAKDERITVIKSDKKSYGYQVNLGFRAATGEYFGIVETDDIVNLKMYERLYQVAVETGVDLVKADFCRFEFVDGYMVKRYADIAKPHMYNKILTKENDRQDIITNAALYTWAGIYKREFLLNNGIFHNESPGASYQDNGFWFQTMSMADSVYFLKESFYMLRRDNPNSSTMSKAKVYCIRDEYEFVLDYLKARPEVYNDLIPYYWWARFGAYRYNYNRIDIEYKWEFLQHFTEVFTTVWNGVEFDESIFSKTSYNDLKNIVLYPESWHKNKIKVQMREQQKRTPLRRFSWVVEDHGIRYAIKYTLKRIFDRLGWIDEAEKSKRYVTRPVTKHIDKKTTILEEKLNLLLEENEKMIALLEKNEQILRMYEDRISALEENK